jgi:hypothetical protein
MLKYILLIVYHLCLAGSVWCQTLVTGKVIGKLDDRPIQYANIGIVNSPIGTISNEDGTFSIFKPLQYSQELLLFSALGYAPEKYVVQTLSGKNSIISLEEKPTILREVAVTPSSQKKITAILGSRVRIFGTQYGDSIAAGAAMALKVRSDKQPTYYPNVTPPLYIQEASLWISQNYLKQFKVRLRILDIDELTGLPGNDLLGENVIITSQIKKGWIKADLSRYKEGVNSAQFYLVFEWIMDDKARHEIRSQFKEYKRLNPERVRADTTIISDEEVRFLHWEGIEAGVWFGAAPANSVYLNNMECYFRENSHAKWEKSYSILAARITVTDRP